MKSYSYIVSTHVLHGDTYIICDEAGRGQDSEGGCMVLVVVRRAIERLSLYRR